MPSINHLISQIEKVICIRKIWRCNAGWGMSFVFTKDDLIKIEGEKEGQQYHDHQKQGIVFKYYPNLTACVVNEYKYWVKKIDAKGYPKYGTPLAKI